MTDTTTDSNRTGASVPDEGIAHRVWQGYHVNDEDSTITEQATFTSREAAMAHVLRAHARVLGPDVTPDEDAFEQANDYVWRVELPGPWTGVVLHAPVYESAGAMEPAVTVEL